MNEPTYLKLTGRRRTLATVCAHKEWLHHSVLHPLGLFEGHEIGRRRTRRRKEYGGRSFIYLAV